MFIKQTIRRSMQVAVAELLILLAGSVTTLSAKQPASVNFDTSSQIACRVLPSTAATVDSGMKLIEARFRVSVLVNEGSVEAVDDVVVLIESPQHRLRVIDFSPKTEVANAVDGEVQTTRTTENSTTAGAQLGGAPIPFYNLASAQLSGTHHEVVAQTIKELPAKCLVLASGTTDGEHGAFFKIKGAPQVPLEGAKEFTCTFEVPKNWRGGWCLVSCHARSLEDHRLSKKSELCGFAETIVGLYVSGDDQAQQVAARLDRLQPQQALSGADREALGLPQDGDTATSTASRRGPFDLNINLVGWTKHAVVGSNQSGAELQQVLADLSVLSGG
jgi:hypothetical protein